MSALARHHKRPLHMAGRRRSPTGPRRRHQSSDLCESSVKASLVPPYNSTYLLSPRPHSLSRLSSQHTLKIHDILTHATYTHKKRGRISHGSKTRKEGSRRPVRATAPSPPARPVLLHRPLRRCHSAVVNSSSLLGVCRLCPPIRPNLDVCLAWAGCICCCALRGQIRCSRSVNLACAYQSIMICVK